MSTAALREAIKQAGSVEDFADICGVSVRQVHNWKKQEGLPPGYVPDVARELGISMHFLRPDKFPKVLT